MAVRVSCHAAVNGSTDRCPTETPPPRIRLSNSSQTRRAAGRSGKTCYRSHTATLFRHTSHATRIRHSHRSAIAGTPRCLDHDDLHTCAQHPGTQRDQPLGCRCQHSAGIRPWPLTSARAIHTGNSYRQFIPAIHTGSFLHRYTAPALRRRPGSPCSRELYRPTANHWLPDGEMAVNGAPSADDAYLANNLFGVSPSP